MATADAAFPSAANAQWATARGVRRGGTAAPRRLVGKPPGASKATLVSAGDELAHGMRGANQLPQTRAASLSLPGSARNETLGTDPLLGCLGVVG